METLHVLVCDDEPGMRSGLIRALGRYTFTLPEVEGDVSFNVDEADTAECALEKINAAEPDILLLDYKLPGMSGLDLLEKLGERTDNILTVMITAYASIETAVVATKRGAYDFLVKPFTPVEMKQVVRKAASRLILTRQARRLAEERKRVRFEFIRVLGHELKAPLNAVEGYLNILESESLGAIPEGYHEMVERSLIRLNGMRKLIADLLDMTRIESGEMKREVSELSLSEIAGRVIETMMPDAEARGITIELHTHGCNLMAGDRSELEMLLNNLVSNAVKYNRDGGRVDVKLSRRDDTMVVEVSDTGIGMEPDEVEKLFGEFVRIKNAKTRNILGSGLGLSIVKKIISLYDGDVKVTSEADVGSTFTVKLNANLPTIASEKPEPREATG